MWAFLQTHGIWILFGILFLLTMRMHSGGMHGMGGGCGMGMGHDQYDEPSGRKRAVPLDEYTDTQRVVPLDTEYSDAQRRALIAGEYADDQRRTLVREIPAVEDNTTTGRYSTKRHSGC